MCVIEPNEELLLMPSLLGRSEDPLMSLMEYECDVCQ